MKVTAKVTRSGNWWAIEVPEVPGVFTQAKRLDQVEAMVADAVALMEAVDVDSVKVKVIPTLPGKISDDVAHVRHLVGEAARLQREASAAVRLVVSELRDDAGLSVRDVGALLDISPQRVSQLAKQ